MTYCKLIGEISPMAITAVKYAVSSPKGRVPGVNLEILDSVVKAAKPDSELTLQAKRSLSGFLIHVWGEGGIISKNMAFQIDRCFEILARSFAKTTTDKGIEVQRLQKRAKLRLLGFSTTDGLKAFFSGVDTRGRAYTDDCNDLIIMKVSLTHKDYRSADNIADNFKNGYAKFREACARHNSVPRNIRRDSKTAERIRRHMQKKDSLAKLAINFDSKQTADAFIENGLKFLKPGDFCLLVNSLENASRKVSTNIRLVSSSTTNGLKITISKAGSTPVSITVCDRREKLNAAKLTESLNKALNIHS